MDQTTASRCPSCHVIMRDHESGWQCPLCGLAEIMQDVPSPALVAPGIHFE